MRNTFSEFIEIVRARLARTTTVDEVQGLIRKVEGFRVVLMQKRLDRTFTDDEARKAIRLCEKRIAELIAEQIRSTFE